MNIEQMGDAIYFMKKYDIQIKIIDTDIQKGPVLTLPFDMIQESKIDILRELIEATIKEMEKPPLHKL